MNPISMWTLFATAWQVMVERALATPNGVASRSSAAGQVRIDFDSSGLGRKFDAFRHPLAAVSAGAIRQGCPLLAFRWILSARAEVYHRGSLPLALQAPVPRWPGDDSDQHDAYVIAQYQLS